MGSVLFYIFLAMLILLILAVAAQSVFRFAKENPDAVEPPSRD